MPHGCLSYPRCGYSWQRVGAWGDRKNVPFGASRLCPPAPRWKMCSAVKPPSFRRWFSSSAAFSTSCFDRAATTSLFCKNVQMAACRVGCNRCIPHERDGTPYGVRGQPFLQAGRILRGVATTLVVAVALWRAPVVCLHSAWVLHILGASLIIFTIYRDGMHILRSRSKRG